MSKAGDLARVSAKGSFHLMWGLVISTVITSVGSIFIARLLGSNLYGLYSIVLTAPNLILIFSDWGINSAIIRYSAQYRAEGRIVEVRSIFISGLIQKVVVGLVLSAVCFAISGVLATDVFHRPEISSLIQLASIAILATGLTNVSTAAFTGMERLELNSIMLISQSVIRTLLVIALVVLGFGTLGAVVGYIVGLSFAGLTGIVLIWTIYKHLPKPTTAKLEIKAYLGDMLKYGVPLSLAAIIGAFLGQFYVFLLPIFYATDNSIIGNYGVAANFVVLITFFATPITTMLFPAFSKLDAQKDKETIRSVFQFSVKYAAILVVPVASLVACLAGPAVFTLFGNTYSSASLFLALLALAYLYTALGNLSINSLLYSQGQTKYVLKLTLLTTAIGFPMGYALIMSFGVIGLIATSLTAGLPSLIVGLRFIEKNYGVTVDWSSSARILVSSAVAASVTYLAISQLSLSSWIELVLGVLIFLIVVVPSILLTKSLNPDDIKNLRGMTSGLGVVGRLLSRVLNILERLMKMLKM